MPTHHSLADTVRHALHRDRRPASLRQIADAAGVDYNWLCKFVHGHITDPGVRKVEAVHKTLFPPFPPVRQ